MSASTKLEVLEEVEEAPSFFGVKYKSGKEFRRAVENSEVNNNMELVQAKGIHGSHRYCLRCNQAGCDFFIFARKKKTSFGAVLVAAADDTIDFKDGKVLKQNFHHSGACRLCPG